MEKRRDYTKEEIMQILYGLTDDAGRFYVDCDYCPFSKLCDEFTKDWYGGKEPLNCRIIMERYFERGVIYPDLDVCLMCGSKNVILEESYDGYYIYCEDCGLRTGTRVKFEKDDLIREWNDIIRV